MVQQLPQQRQRGRHQWAGQPGPHVVGGGQEPAAYSTYLPYAAASGSFALQQQGILQPFLPTTASRVSSMGATSPYPPQQAWPQQATAMILGQQSLSQQQQQPNLLYIASSQQQSVPGQQQPDPRLSGSVVQRLGQTAEHHLAVAAYAPPGLQLPWLQEPVPQSFLQVPPVSESFLSTASSVPMISLRLPGGPAGPPLDFFPASH
jgi:hypothetical protein